MLRRTLLAIAAMAGLPLSTLSNAQDQFMQPPQPTASGHAAVNGVEIYYQTYGSGDPIVLLHGGFGAIEMFGPVIGILAEDHTVIGMDMQAHGRTLPFEGRPMTLENMAGDVAGVIRHLGYEKADILGYSAGGMTALQVGLRHPEVVDKLILVSTPYARSGWHQYNLDSMSQIGLASAEAMKASPMYDMYSAIAAAPETNWVKLHTMLGALVNTDYHYADALSEGLPMPTMLVDGDWDSVRMSHVVSFFEKLGGGLQDAQWDGSGMNRNRLAILPGQTHYTIFMSQMLADVTLAFIDAE